MNELERLTSAVNWNEQGLVAAIAEDYRSGETLTLAWMNAESLKLTVQEQRAIYWSRSRGKLWRKGEESGHVQRLKAIYLDCDGDSILLKVEQVGGIACHTGRANCFYRQWKDGDWQTVQDIIKPADEIYKK